jgi:formylglycine-generating enzyme required for sulfatase activity
VTGGTFYRSYDGAAFTDMTHPATVSSFRLDKFEITVGRFRQFVNAWVSGWRPGAGAGKHSHLNGGNGLANSGSAGTYEAGWDPTWDASLGTTASAWDTNLSCGSSGCTWTSAAGVHEKLPINYVTWYEAYAFCIWDGGFLPSETEWNYAAAGGGEQRVYPWSSPPSSTAIDCSYLYYAPCLGTPATVNAVGSESPKGNGKYGQADLSGNVFEMNLDFYTNYASPCVDCAYLVSSTSRAMRGGGYTGDANSVKVSARWTTTLRNAYQGARCARSP